MASAVALPASPPWWLRPQPPLQPSASPLAPPPDPQAAAGHGAHEGAGPAAASAASSSSRSTPSRRGHGRGMSAEPPPEPEDAAASEPAAGAMPEKRPGAQAAGGLSVSAGAAQGAWAGPGCGARGSGAGGGGGVRGQAAWAPALGQPVLSGATPAPRRTNLQVVCCLGKHCARGPEEKWFSPFGNFQTCGRRFHFRGAVPGPASSGVWGPVGRERSGRSPSGFPPGSGGRRGADFIGPGSAEPAGSKAPPARYGGVENIELQSLLKTLGFSAPFRTGNTETLQGNTKETFRQRKPEILGKLNVCGRLFFFFFYKFYFTDF